jgi:hypothetical protein
MKGKPQITDAKLVANRTGASGVVVLAFDGTKVAAASYGVTKEHCRLMAKWLDSLIDRMVDGRMPEPYGLDATMTQD